jgi:hypothetical protein
MKASASTQAGVGGYGNDVGLHRDLFGLVARAIGVDPVEPLSQVLASEIMDRIDRHAAKQGAACNPDSSGQ